MVDRLLLPIFTYQQFQQQENHYFLDRFQEQRDTVKRIISRVRDEGDPALIDLTRSLDGVELSGLKVTSGEMARAGSEVPTGLQQTIRRAGENIEKFHRRQLPSSWWEPGEGQVVVRFTRWCRRYLCSREPPLSFLGFDGCGAGRLAGVKIALSTPPDNVVKSTRLSDGRPGVRGARCIQVGSPALPLWPTGWNRLAGGQNCRSRLSVLPGLASGVICCRAQRTVDCRRRTGQSSFYRRRLLSQAEHDTFSGIFNATGRLLRTGFYLNENSCSSEERTSYVPGRTGR